MTTPSEVDYVSEDVIYRVTVESPERATYVFTSMTHDRPYDNARLFYRDLPSECARITEQWIRRTETQTIDSRGYGGTDV